MYRVLSISIKKYIHNRSSWGKPNNKCLYLVVFHWSLLKSIRQSQRENQDFSISRLYHDQITKTFSKHSSRSELCKLQKKMMKIWFIQPFFWWLQITACIFLHKCFYKLWWFYVKTTVHSAPGGRFYFDDTQSHWVLSAPDMKELLLMKVSTQTYLEHLDFWKH